MLFLSSQYMIMIRKPSLKTGENMRVGRKPVLNPAMSLNRQRISDATIELWKAETTEGTVRAWCRQECSVT